MADAHQGPQPYAACRGRIYDRQPALVIRTEGLAMREETIYDTPGDSQLASQSTALHHGCRGTACRARFVEQKLDIPRNNENPAHPGKDDVPVVQRPPLSSRRSKPQLDHAPCWNALL